MSCIIKHWISLFRFVLYLHSRSPHATFTGLVSEFSPGAGRSRKGLRIAHRFAWKRLDVRVAVTSHIHAGASHGIFTVAIAPIGHDAGVGISVLRLENWFDDDLDWNFLVIVMDRARVVIGGGFEDVDIAGRWRGGSRCRHDMRGVIIFNGAGIDFNWVITADRSLRGLFRGGSCSSSCRSPRGGYRDRRFGSGLWRFRGRGTAENRKWANGQMGWIVIVVSVVVNCVILKVYGRERERTRKKRSLINTNSNDT